MKNLPYGIRFQTGIATNAMTAASPSAVVFHTPNAAIRIRRIPIQTTVFTARRVSSGNAFHRSCVRPAAPSALHQPFEIARRTSPAFRCSLAEEALGAEDEDEDQDREDDRLGPVTP